MARALDAIGDWWSLLIIRDAFQGVRRFGEFEHNLGVAKNILTARLRKLVAVGILEVAPASDGSKYQEYVLTKKAAGLYLVIIALKQWEESCFPGRKQAHGLVDRKKGQPVLRWNSGRRMGDCWVRRMCGWWKQKISRDTGTADQTRSCVCSQFSLAPWEGKRLPQSASGG